MALFLATQYQIQDYITFKKTNFVLFIYLFIHSLFIYILSIHLYINLFKGHTFVWKSMESKYIVYFV